MTTPCEPHAPNPPVNDGSGEQLRVLSTEECTSLLHARRLGRLAFATEDQATIFPVNYLFEGTSVVVRTGPGFKLEEAPMRSVAFEIDDADPDGAWGWSVVVQGPCFDVTDTIDDASARIRELPVRPWAPGSREHWLRIVSRHISGRSFGRAPSVSA